MKVLRKILVFLLWLILSGLMFALLLSFVFKEVVQEGIIVKSFKESLVPSITNNLDLDDESKEKLDNLLNDSELNGIVDSFVENIIGSLGGQEEINGEYIDEIINYFEENEDELEDIFGVDVNISSTISKEDIEEIKENITKTVDKRVETLDDTSKSFVRVYSFIISTTFKIYLIIGIVIDLLLIMLVQWSLYKWIKTFGKSLVCCGITLSIFLILIKYVLQGFLNKNSVDINFDLTTLIYMVIGCLVSGIVLIIVGTLIDKSVKKKNEMVAN